MGLRYTEVMFVPPKLLILDVDGTLIKPDIDWEYARRRLKELGIDADGVPVAEAFARLASRDSELAKKLESEVRRMELESARKVRGDPELKSLIMNLRRSGCRVAIVTLRGRDTATAVLEALGIGDVVDALVTREDSYDRRTQLAIVLRRFGVRPSEAVFVGDTHLDVEAGERVGVKVYVVDSRHDPVSNVPRMVKKILRLIARTPATPKQSPSKEVGLRYVRRGE